MPFVSAARSKEIVTVRLQAAQLPVFKLKVVGNGITVKRGQGTGLICARFFVNSGNSHTILPTKLFHILLQCVGG